MRKDSQLVDPLNHLLGYHLRRASAVAMADLGNALEPIGLSPTLASVLLMIEANPGTPQSRIGHHLGIKRANIAPMIAKLEKNDLITRKDLPGRAVGLHCSPKGKSTSGQIKAIMAEHEARVFGYIAQDSQAELISTLNTVVESDATLKKKVS